MTYKIEYTSSNPSKKYDMNESENLYFDSFESALTDEENSKIVLKRMSNGAIEPYFNGYPLGKIKLQGRKHSMQILKSLYKFEEIDGDVYDFIKRIDDVVMYLRKYCK